MSTSISHEVFCDPFSVYAAKHFPGMTGTRVAFVAMAVTQTEIHNNQGRPRYRSALPGKASRSLCERDQG